MLTLSFLLAQAGKATLILATAYGISILLRRSSAAARHLVWALALVSVLLLPFISVSLPDWQPLTFHAPASIPGISIDVMGNGGSSPALTWTQWALAIWATGCILCLLRIGVGLARLFWIQRGAEPGPTPIELPLALGMKRVPILLYTTQLRMPTTFGWLHPVVMLPEEAQTWAPERLNLVLAHELAHVRRGDWLTMMFAYVACSLYWFHPLAWMAAQQLKKEQELACDDRVLTLGARGSRYAEHLLDIARSSVQRSAPEMTVAMAQFSTLESRLRAILDTQLDRRGVSAWKASSAAVLAILAVIPLAGLKSVAQGSTASVTGLISDSSGARVPNASVVLSRIDGENREIATTNRAGEYALNRVPPGKYEVEVRKPGFAVLRKTLNLTSGSVARTDGSLSLGSVNESMDIVGSIPAQPADETPSQIEVGGTVQATRIVRMTRPAYPEHLKAQGIEGSVVLRAVIGTDGHLLNLTVLNSTANPELAEVAKAAVSKWQYQPTLLNGKPVEVVTSITVNFRLNRQ